MGHIARNCFRNKNNNNEQGQRNYNNKFKKNYNDNKPDEKKKRNYQPEDKKKYESKNENAKTVKKSKSEENSDEEMDVNLAKSNRREHSYMTVGENTKARKLMKIRGALNEKEIEFVLDTGATQSVISKELVEKLKIKYDKTEKLVNVADGNLCKPIGITKPIDVMIHGSRCKLKMMILPLYKIPILLGIDWLEDVDREVKIDVKNRKIKIGEKVIDVDANQQVEDVFHLNKVNEEEEEFDDELGPEADDDEDWTDAKQVKYEYNNNLSEEQNEKVRKFLEKHDRVFAYTINDLKPCKFAKAVIKTTSEEPIYMNPYRKSAKERQLLNAEVQKMLKAKIIRHSNSPWAFPALLLTKKDGSYRFCVDYRKLNKLTVPDPFPIPRIDDILDRLNGSVWFTIIDLKSGYWQIVMDEESIAKTAFCTSDGHFEFLRLPFGLQNAPKDFCRTMYRIFGNMPFVQIYFDDFTIHSKTFEEHLDHIKQVFDKLEEMNLSINKQKCSWFQKTTKILGHVVSNNTIMMNPEKIEAVKKWSEPKNVKGVQGFLGITGYYRRFIKDYAKIAMPLTNLLKKDTKWKFDQQCKDAFNELKNKLISYPILRQPEINKPFILYTDASGYALGAILAQKDDDGAEYVCNYASRTLKGREVHYGISEKECLAILWAVKYFRIYLYGTRFSIVTDHAALQWLMNMSDPTGRLMRWSIYLQIYEFEIIYRKGKKHSNVDALSRILLTEDTNERVDEENDEDEEAKLLDPFEDDCLLQFIRTGKYLNGASKKKCKRVARRAEHYVFDDKDNLRYRKRVTDADFKMIVPKLEERREVIEKAHIIGHFAAHETYLRVKQEYYWPRMMKDIKKYIKRCFKCLRHQKVPVVNHPALSTKITGIFDKIGIDLVFGLPTTSEGYNGILVIIDFLSKYPYATPIKSKTKEEIAQKLFEYIALFGAPKEILSDQGNEFVNDVIYTLNEIAGIEHRITSAYHPQANGQTENFNKTLITCLKKHTEEEPSKWHLWIPYVLMAYRSRVHASTKTTPYELLFGRKMNNLNNWSTEKDEEFHEQLYKRSVEIRKLYEIDVKKAKTNIKKAQAQQRKNQDNNNTVQEEKLKEGTKVFIKGCGIKAKLEPYYYGPYTVDSITEKGNYWLKNANGELLKTSYPLSRLKIVVDDIDEEVKSGEKPTEIQKKRGRPKKRQEEPEIVEVETILNHRKRYNKMEYLVKWKDFPESENQWVKESDFDSTEPIEEYYRNLNKSRESVNLCRQIEQEESNRGHSKWYKIWLLVILVLQLFNNTNALKIEDKFKFCTTDQNSPVVNMRDSCKNFHIVDKSASNEYLILEKRKYLVDGYGFVCTRKRVEIETFSNFFGIKSIQRYTVPEVVSKEECQAMILTNKCDGHNMTCSQDYCEAKTEPNVQYAWLNYLWFKSYHCFVSKRVIYSDSLDKPIFKNSDSTCFPGDHFCRISTQTYIWDSNIIHKCPYYTIKRSNMTIINNLASSESDNLLLQLTRKFNECGTEIIESTEGLYITMNTRNAKLEEAEVNMNGKYHLVLADIDFKTNSMFEILNKYNDKIGLQLCNSIKLILKNLNRYEEDYFIIYDSNNNELVLNKQDDELLVAKCINIEKLFLKTNSSKCFYDIPVTFELNNNKINGFLTNDGIIKINSQLQECKNQRRVVTLPSKEFNLVKYNERVKIEYIKKNKYELSLLSKNNSHINYTHAKELINDFDLIKQIEKFMTIKDNDENYLINLKAVNSSFLYTEELAKLKATNLISNIIRGVSYIITCIVIGGLIMLIRWTTKYIKKRRARKNRDNIESHDRSGENNIEINVVTSSGRTEQTEPERVHLITNNTMNNNTSKEDREIIAIFKKELNEN